MGWYYNNIRIVVQEYGSNEKQIIARLQPLSGGTIKQIFGYETPVVKVGCVVVGDTDLEALKALTKTGVAYSLVGYEQNYGNYYLSSITVNRLMSVYQTVRKDLPCNSPLYAVELELMV
jgi:phage protein U